MKKRLLPGLLAVALTLTLLPGAALAAGTGTDEIAQVLSALDIMTGNDKGELNLTGMVTRAEFTKLTMAASPTGGGVGTATTVSPYPDVPRTHWAAPYVEAAVNAGYVTGNVYGYFEPDRTITLKEGVTMAVRVLGYTDADFTGAWPSGQMALYFNQHLDEGISIGQDTVMTRQDAMHLFYNLLTARTKEGKVYLTTLGYPLTSTGEVDRVALVNAAMDGPVVMGSGWQSKVGFDVSGATVYRGGALSSLTALQANDVIYYSKSMRTVWAYTNKVTGLYQAVTPTATAPASVTVAGKTYTVETTEAAYALSNLGKYKVGDTVTLLLGRTGGVAAVGDVSASSGGVMYGVVTDVTTGSYNDVNGNSYTSKTMNVTATDGNSYTYPVDEKVSFKAGALVQVNVVNGIAQVARLSQASVSGKVNAAGTQIGSNKLSPSAEILETNSDGAAMRIYPSRLAGMELKNTMVSFYQKGTDGAIEKLILRDATGDLYSYGILTSSDEINETIGGVDVMSGSYAYDVGGETYTTAVKDGVLNLDVGPYKIQGPLQAPTKFIKLDSVKLTTVAGTTATTADNGTYPVADAVAVYELESGTYHLSSLERVKTGYTLTGYYDKPASQGGIIRVIVARAG